MVALSIVFTIFHLLGVVAGAGAAFVSDVLFLRATRDGRLTKEEYGTLKTVGYVIWGGLGTLYLSGLVLFFMDMERLLGSDKFLAKVTIVAIITINGIIFHKMHLPMLEHAIGGKLHDHRDYRKRSVYMYASGAVSVVSWVSALILGSFSSMPMTYLEIIFVYFALLTFALASAIGLHRVRN